MKTNYDSATHNKHSPCKIFITLKLCLSVLISQKRFHIAIFIYKEISAMIKAFHDFF